MLLMKARRRLPISTRRNSYLFIPLPNAVHFTIGSEVNKISDLHRIKMV